MRPLLFTAVLLVLLQACAPPAIETEEPTLDFHQMQATLMALHLAHGPVGAFGGDFDAPERSQMAQGRYVYVLDSLGVSGEDFQQSLLYYQAHPVLMDSIYDGIIQQLDSIQSLYRGAPLVTPRRRNNNADSTRRRPSRPGRDSSRAATPPATN